jgi:uncharacterized protein
LKTVTVQPRDFSGHTHFPGRSGNPFDKFLHRAELLQEIPWPIFGLILLAVSLLPHFPHIEFNLLFFAFLICDWALISALPRVGISYGPSKPPTLILSFLRVLPALFLPLIWMFALQIIGTLLVWYGFWIEPRHVQLTRQSLVSSKIKSTQALKILHVADLHVERITTREREIEQIIDREQPDLILFSGDFLNLSYLHDLKAIQSVRELISNWKAPLGMFAVTGSPAVDLADNVPAILDGMNLRRLDNQGVEVQHDADRIHVVGVTCTHKPFKDAPALQTLIQPDDDRFTLCLYHSPDLAPEAARIGVDLQLSGHTHGGQVCLPFIGAIYASSLYCKLFESGHYKLGDMHLYVSRGIGMEGAAAPRVRFLCPPEVILWEIRSTQTA